MQRSKKVKHSSSTARLDASHLMQKHKWRELNAKQNKMSKQQFQRKTEKFIQFHNIKQPWS